MSIGFTLVTSQGLHVFGPFRVSDDRIAFHEMLRRPQVLPLYVGVLLTVASSTVRNDHKRPILPNIFGDQRNYGTEKQINQGDTYIP